MLRKLESFIPRFLKDLDQRLLLHRPGLWATKIHYVAFFSIIGLGLVGLQAWLQPVALTSPPDLAWVFAIAVIPALIAFGLWAYKLSLFQVHRSFGKGSPLMHQRDQLLYGLTILIFAAVPFLFTEIQNHKLANAVSSPELAMDIDALNLGERYFPENHGYFKHNYLKKEFRQDMNSHMLYQRYSFNDFGVHTMNAQDIKRAQRRRYCQSYSREHIDAYLKAFYKYGGEYVPYTAEQLLNRYNARKITLIDGKYEVEQNIRKIIQAKNRSHGFQKAEFYKLSVFFLFSCWLMLLVFSQTSWKYFVWAILGGGAILLIEGIAIAVYVKFVDPRSPDILWIMYVGTFIVLLVQAFRTSNSKKVNTWKSVAMILATAMTPLLPLILGLINHEDMNDNVGFVLLFAGIGLSILLWNGMYHRRFVELQAEPKDN